MADFLVENFDFFTHWIHSLIENTLLGRLHNVNANRLTRLPLKQNDPLHKIRKKRLIQSAHRNIDQLLNLHF